MKKRIFAIGDVHGCIKTFRKMVMEEIKVEKTDVLYCLGDYIDRGGDSKGVIDFILELRAKGYTVHTLRGNHEQIMMDSGHEGDLFNLWMDNGGLETLKSFGASSYDDFAPQYKSFFEQTDYFLTDGRYIFVHAGLNFDYADPFQDKQAMMWIRGQPIDNNALGNRILVHGHTPMALDRILEQTGKNVIDIDGGCVYTKFEGFGNLIALEVTENKLRVVRNCETTSPPPTRVTSPPAPLRDGEGGSA
jgi:serine/threonine protein phosphatase 1